MTTPTPPEPFAYYNVGIEYHTKDKIIFHKEPTRNLEARWWGPDTPLYSAPPPAGAQIDWQDMYLKAKSEKEAMAAKYEKDIGPLARVAPAMHLSEILAEKGITLRTEFEEKPRDHIERAGKMPGERAELIARLTRKADARDYLQPGAKRLNACRQAANMLEADAREIAATERQVEILSDELSKCGKAQQVAVPDGYALVPIEPTPAMSAAGFCVAEADHDPAGVYRAMLAAAQGVKP